MSFEIGVVTALTEQDREAERTATMETPAPGGGGGAPTNATYVVLSVNATLTNERVLTETANQVIITDNGAGSTVVLSLPQSIATTSSPTFTYLTLATGFTVTNFGNGAVLYTSGAGIVNGNGNGLFFSTGVGLVVNLASGSTVDLLVRTSSMPEALFVDASANAIGINQGTIDPSAILDITSTTKGLLPPRMTTAQRNAIGSPAAGLVLYDVTTGLLNYRNASAWVTLTTPTIDGSGAATRVTFWSDADTVTGDAGFTFDGVTLFVTDSNSATTPLFIATQSSTGDAATRYVISTTISYAVGIDNSVAGDPFKISTAASATAVLGTGDLITLTSAGNFGIGRAPGYKLDVNGGSIASQVHIVSSDTDSGGYITSTASNDFIMSGGAAFDATNWIAKATTASFYQANGGSHFFYGNTGLTAGNSFTPGIKFTINVDGRVYGSALHNNAGAVTGTTNQYIASGTYTPTLFNTTNVAASTAYACQWLRVGNVVTVSGKVDIDPTLAGDTVLGISLPIASNIGAAEDLAGAAQAPGAAAQGAALLGDLTNDRATLQYVAIAAALGNLSYYFTFTYEVI